MNMNWFGGAAAAEHDDEDQHDDERTDNEEENFDSEVVKSKKITSTKKFNKFLREINHDPSELSGLRSRHMTVTLYRQFGIWTFSGQSSGEIQKYKTAEGHLSNIKLMVTEDIKNQFNEHCKNRIEKCYPNVLNEVFNLFRKDSVDNNVPMITNAVPILYELHGRICEKFFEFGLYDLFLLQSMDYTLLGRIEELSALKHTSVLNFKNEENTVNCLQTTFSRSKRSKSKKNWRQSTLHMYIHKDDWRKCTIFAYAVSVAMATSPSPSLFPSLQRDGTTFSKILNNAYKVHFPTENINTHGNRAGAKVKCNSCVYLDRKWISNRGGWEDYP